MKIITLLRKTVLPCVSLAGVALMLSCSTENSKTHGRRTEALDDSVWSVSQWISAVDAPVVNDIVYDVTRSADGANWFVSSVQNRRNCSV